MLKSQARRRITTKAAAAGVLSMGALLGGIPAIAALVPKDVTYTCSTTSTEATEYAFGVELVSPMPAATQGAMVTVTWNILQPSAQGSSPLPARSSLAASANKVVLEGEVVVSGSPVAAQPQAQKASASVTPLTDVAPNASLTLPTMLVTLRPTATGYVAVKPDKFLLKVVPTAAASPSATWYTCTVKTAAQALAAAMTFSVAPSATSTSPSPSNTKTSPTPTKSKTTHTVFKTVTKKPKSPSEQVTKKPGGGADTGGGGDAGPDGRTFVMVGTLLVLGAGAGGLMMRHRRPRRG